LVFEMILECEYEQKLLARASLDPERKMSRDEQNNKMLFLRVNNGDAPWSRLFGVMQADILFVLAFIRLVG